MAIHFEIYRPYGVLNYLLCYRNISKLIKHTSNFFKSTRTFCLTTGKEAQNFPEQTKNVHPNYSPDEIYFSTSFLIANLI